MFRDNVWIREGNFKDQLPKEIKANCDYFVRYRKGKNSLCLFKRKDAKNPDQFEYKIIYTFLTKDLVDRAIQLKAYDDNAKKYVEIAINPHHTGGTSTPTDGIETCYIKKLDHLEIALVFIDGINPLNEIKDEVYSCFGIQPRNNKIDNEMTL